jgi:hypothetical protein
MKHAKKRSGGGEIDTIKAFIVIMIVLTVGLAGYTFLHLRGKLDELQKANARSKRQIETILQQREELTRYLKAYGDAKAKGGIASPEEYFASVLSQSGIPDRSMKLTPGRESGHSKEYQEVYAAISLDGVTWDQIIRFMWNTEHNSPKYRILSIDSLSRIESKEQSGLWKITLKAAFRTQRET